MFSCCSVALVVAVWCFTVFHKLTRIFYDGVWLIHKSNKAHPHPRVKLEDPSHFFKSTCREVERKT